MRRPSRVVWTSSPVQRPFRKSLGDLLQGNCGFRVEEGVAGHAEGLFPRPAVEELCAVIPIGDSAGHVPHNDGVVRQIEKARLFRELAGDFLAGGDFQFELRVPVLGGVGEFMLADGPENEGFVHGDRPLVRNWKKSAGISGGSSAAIHAPLWRLRGCGIVSHRAGYLENPLEHRQEFRGGVRF